MHYPDRQVYDDAADWLARLGSGSRLDWSDPGLRAWLDQDTSHRLALTELVADWFAAVELEAPEKEPVAPAPRIRRPHRRLPLAAFASLLVLVGSWAFLPRLQDGWRSLGKGPVGAPGRIVETVLEDGTEVHLAPGASLSVHFDGTMRIVRLMGTAAYFEVEPQPRRPFRVVFDEGAVQVLGTAFGVRAQDGRRIDVSHGRVELRGGGGETLELTAGTSARMTPQGLERLPPDTEQGLSWLRGRLVYDTSPLEMVIRELCEFDRQQLLLLTDLSGRGPVSAVIELDRIPQALETLASRHDFRVHRLPGLTIVR